MNFLKRTWAEVHLNRLCENITNFKAILAPENELLCVVKAFCYGHSDEGICPYLEDKLGIKWFAVSNEEEAIRLRNIGIKGEILILGYTPPEYAPMLIEKNIIQAVTELSYAKALSQHCGEKDLRCHVAIDTGMTRIGLRGEIADIANDVEKISTLDGISLEGIFTHYAAADSDSNEDIAYTKNQTDKFFAVSDELARRGVKLLHSHCLNSAGGLYHGSSKSSLVRLGIVLYGIMPNTANPLPITVSPVLDLKAVISQVKTVEADVDVSYGRTYTTKKPTILATISCGYADGYPRALSNIGDVLIHGKRAKITGRVCMDQFMCDVTDIDDVKAGEIATLIGTDGSQTITADEIADKTGTIGYEIVCQITSRVPRVMMNNGGVVKICKI